MPANPQIQVPASTIELLQNPQRVRDAFTLLNMLLAMRVELTTPNTRGVASLTVGGQNIILPIPLQFSRNIAQVTAGGTTDTNCRATVNALLTALTLNGQNPPAA